MFCDACTTSSSTTVSVVFLPIARKTWRFPSGLSGWDKLVGELNIPELSVRPRPKPRLPDFLHDDILYSCHHGNQNSENVQPGEILESILNFLLPTPLTQPTAPPKSLTPPIATPTSSLTNLDHTNVGLLKPMQWKLLPPSAFTARKNC